MSEYFLVETIVAWFFGLIFLVQNKVKIDFVVSFLIS